MTAEKLSERVEWAALQLERARLAYNEASANLALETQKPWIVATVTFGPVDQACGGALDLTHSLP
jgi:hypothetical protein